MESDLQTANNDAKSDVSDLTKMLLTRYINALLVPLGATSHDNFDEIQGALIGCVKAAEQFVSVDGLIAVAREALQEQIGEDGCVLGSYAIISESLYKMAFDKIPPMGRLQIDGIDRLGFDNVQISELVFVNPIKKV